MADTAVASRDQRGTGKEKLTPAIQVSRLSKNYGQTVALSEVSFSVPRGEVFGLLGPNGAGKTTLVKLLLGLTRATSGEGLLLGSALGSRAARRQVGYLPELFRYQGWLTAAEVMKLHCRLAGLERSSWSEVIDSALTTVGLSERSSSRVAEFSKGMQQRLGLGVALLGRPELVLLDEPTSALDPVGRFDVRAVIRDLREQGVAVFLNSHLLSEVEQVCDRVAVMDHGRLVASGRVAELLVEPQVRVRCTGLTEDARAQLRTFGEVREEEQGWLTIAGLAPERVPEVIRSLMDSGARVYAVDPAPQTLEARFLQLIKGPK